MQGAVQRGLGFLRNAVEGFWLRRPPPFDPNWTKKQVGNWGEDWAQWHYFHKRNAAILARNWRGGGGELDLVVREGLYLVFVEVKTRDPNDPAPLAAVRDEKRQRHFQRAAAAYRSRLGRPRPPVRFDVLLVTPNPRNPFIPQIDCLLDVYAKGADEEDAGMLSTRIRREDANAEPY